jgi:alkylation response protein AidB-like acyl-CoA dehydrogenase
MDFGFSEQQGEVQALARQILSEQVTPGKLAAYDEYRTERFDRNLWRQLAEAGLLGVAIEESYGGMGFGFTELSLFVEELGRSIAPVPAIPALVSVALPIQRFGSSEQKERWLPGVVSGEILLSAALVEPGNESPDAPALTTAKADGEGYRLSGIKTCVPFARAADRVLLAAACADGVLVALLDPAAEGVSLRDLK